MPCAKHISQSGWYSSCAFDVLRHRLELYGLSLFGLRGVHSLEQLGQRPSTTCLHFGHNRLLNVGMQYL